MKKLSLLKKIIASVVAVSSIGVAVAINASANDNDSSYGVGQSVTDDASSINKSEIKQALEATRNDWWQCFTYCHLSGHQSAERNTLADVERMLNGVKGILESNEKLSEDDYNACKKTLGDIKSILDEIDRRYNYRKEMAREIFG